MIRRFTGKVRHGPVGVPSEDRRLKRVKGFTERIKVFTERIKVFTERVKESFPRNGPGNIKRKKTAARKSKPKIEETEGVLIAI